MARRRLITILATTLAAGMVSMPALAGPLDDVTGPLEDTVGDVTETVTEVTTPVGDAVGTVTETLEPVTEAVEPVSEAATPVTEPVTEVVETVQDAVEPVTDAASPVTDALDPVTEAVDPVDEVVDTVVQPDPEPQPEPEPTPTSDGSSDDEGTTSTPQDQRPATPAGPGGFLPGGGVVAAGDDPRPLGDGVTAQGVGLDLGGFGVTRFGGGGAAPSASTGGQVDEVSDPEVAPPAVADTTAPSVLEPETPAVMAAGGATAEDGGVTAAALRALAAAMVLGTGVLVGRRVTDA